ncbi:MAG: hypothetical protein K0Q76_77 [Panacagrimonas sp.]|nr:hypothetical protein [Panacagrimonas sp.]
MRTASSSSSYVMIDSTGPKISSCAIVLLGSTRPKTVGATNQPLSEGTGASGPPQTSVAPSSMPFLR